MRGSARELRVEVSFELLRSRALGVGQRERRERGVQVGHPAALRPELVAEALRNDDLALRRDRRVQHETGDRLLGGRLRGAQVESPDIRAGMAILLAALCATGESTIDNVGQIERGYERIDERLRALGAKIERVEERRQT